MRDVFGFVTTRRRVFAARRLVGPVFSALGLALLIAACGGDDDSGGTVPSALPALQPLRATRAGSPGIYDAQGRQVLLRGINLNSLGDYYQANANYAPVIPLNDTDFPRMASHGFNVVRLVLNWSALEPQPGRISTEYLARIRAAVDAAKASGIYVILDMHQDAWGKYIATPAAVTCPAGREVAIGWDGAPEWETITDGRGTCREPGMRELSFAVIRSFDNFYNDRDGIQSHLVDAWAALAGAFGREPAVAGYDLINEPHFGSHLTGAAPKLAAFYTRAIPAIRAAERAAGGLEHIVFFEPVIVWPVIDAAPAPEFTDDENIVFAPHNYSESITGLNSLTIEEAFAVAVGNASAYATTFWIGEYGWFSDPPLNNERLIRYAREEDRLLIGSAWWQWKQACGDPHSIGRPNGEPASRLTHFSYSRCPGDIDDGPVPEWKVVLSRPYPRAAPGRLLSLESDGDTRTLQLTGEAAGAAQDARLDLWVPSSSAGPPHLSGIGVSQVDIVEVLGGYRVSATVSGRYEVRVDSP